MMIVPHGGIYGHAVMLSHCEGGMQSKTLLCTNQKQCINALVDKIKYNEFSVIHNKLIMLYIFFNKSFPFEYMVLSYNNSPTCMINIFL